MTSKAGWYLLASLVWIVSVRAEERFPHWGKARFEPVECRGEAVTGPVTQDRVRVAAYNLENFTDGEGDGPERTPERVKVQAASAAAFLAEIDPDVLILIELENAEALDALNQALPKPYPRACITQLGSGGPDENKLNLGLLSRVPLGQVKEVDFGDLQGPGRPTRGLLRVQLDLGEQHKLLIYGVHLKSNWGLKPRNIAQRKAALNILRRDADWVMKHQTNAVWEVMVLGDMNVDPDDPSFADDPSLDALSDYRDLWRGRPLQERITLPTRLGDPAKVFPPVTFDRIFVSPALTEAPWAAGPAMVRPGGVNTNDVNASPGDGTHVSDHYPIYVDVVR